MAETPATYGEFFRIVRGKWFSLYATFLVMAGAGSSYLFGVYSKEIKASMGYDQTTLNLLSFSKDIGVNIGVISGLLAEVTPTWFVLLLGASMNFTGYFLIWLAIAGKIAKPKIWQMCLYICMGANSQNFANTGALATAVRNFPEARGALLGLLKGFTALSGAIIAQLYLAMYGNGAAKSLILLIAWLPAALILVFVFAIRELPRSTRPNELKIFYQCLYVSIFLALFLMVTTILENTFVFTKLLYVACAVVSCVLLFVPLPIFMRQESKLLKQNRIVVRGDPTPENHQNLNNNNVVSTPTQKGSWFFHVFRNKPERGEDYTILQALLSIDMVIILVGRFCGLGSSLTAIDNMGQIGESLKYPPKAIKSLVSLSIIWNFFGRIFAGFVSESLLARYKFPRPLMMTLTLSLSSIGLLLIAFPFPGSLYIASIIIGFSFGAQFPLFFSIISELFGLKHYPALFNCAQLASPLGTYVLNVMITGSLYDREARKYLADNGLTRSDVKELTCIGSHCYRLAFIILAGVTFFGALSSLALVVRTRKFYKGDIYRKFRERTEEVVKQELPVTTHDRN